MYLENGAEVRCWYPGSVCAQFRIDGTNVGGDLLFADGQVTHTHGLRVKHSLPSLEATPTLPLPL